MHFGSYNVPSLANIVGELIAGTIGFEELGNSAAAFRRDASDDDGTFLRNLNQG
jgi:hypothetical protein